MNLHALYRFVPTRLLVVALLAGAPAACGGSDAASDGAFAKDKQSYGSLAQQRVPPAFSSVIAGVGEVSESTLPHETKTLRKQVGTVRDYVDVFSFAYKLDKKDTWDDVREDLDEGYETIGSFKDLFDAQGLELAVFDPQTNTWSPGVHPEDVTYEDTELVAERRAKVIAWQERMLEPERLDRYTAYLKDPDKKKLFDHPVKDQSQFFWGGAEIEPKLDKSGLENIARLTGALLDRAEKDFDHVDDVKDLTKDEDHEVFHDFRKRVRSIVKLCGYFPEILKTGTKTDSLVALLTELVDRYGALNDKLLAYDLAREEGHDAEAETIGNEVDDLWDELRDWQKDQDIDKSFDELRDRVKGIK